jgi:hypothetical protein
MAKPTPRAKEGEGDTEGQGDGEAYTVWAKAMVNGIPRDRAMAKATLMA